jgi:hypothetical protein
MAEEFQPVAGHLALDFANTLDNRYDRRPHGSQWLIIRTSSTGKNIQIAVLASSRAC